MLWFAMLVEVQSDWAYSEDGLEDSSCIDDIICPPVIGQQDAQPTIAPCPVRPVQGHGAAHQRTAPRAQSDRMLNHFGLHEVFRWRPDCRRQTLLPQFRS